MAIRKSAAADIRQWLEHLSDADAQVREAALARLGVAGVRAVPQLLDALDATTSPAARATVLRALEATGDRRGVDAALGVMHSRAADPTVAAAAVRLLGSHLETEESDRALDALSAIVLDPAHRQALRLDAFAELARLPSRVIAPLRKWLATDPDETVRARAAADAPGGATSVDPVAQLELAAEGQPADPSALRTWVDAAAGVAALSTLHRLIEVARTRQHEAPSPADRDDWAATRGALHVALAARGSRVAVYDLREWLVTDRATTISDAVIEALREVGDAACLEPIAAAIASMPIDLETRDHRRYDGLVAAGRAIVSREKITRRQAVAKKMLKAWPEAGGLLLSAPSAG